MTTFLYILAFLAVLPFLCMLLVLWVRAPKGRGEHPYD